MSGTPKVLLIVTQDTKREEAKFLRQELEAAGCGVIHLDASVRQSVGGAEISPEQIAEAAGMTIQGVRDLKHEGKCLEVMMQGALKIVLDLHGKGGFSGVLGLGGSLGTTLGTAVMQALPYGLPKLMISTMASGFTAPFVGVKDIIMANAVTDVSGVNSISRDIYRNAALAMAGMAKGYEGARAADRPLVLIGGLGTTEPCTARVRKSLEAEGFEVMAFHTSGAGGATLDSIAADRPVAAVLDFSLTEIIDRQQGGLCAGSPDRSKAALQRGVTTIFAPGNADFLVGGPIEQSKIQFPGRRYHIHNPALTAVRTNMDDLKMLADHVAALAGEAKGPVKFFVPLKGFSNHDSPAGYLHDLSIPPQFADYVKSVMPANVEVRVFDCHMNDPEFADAAVEVAKDAAKASVA
jgi:uncharacterized protein (UPF0261 family)